MAQLFTLAQNPAHREAGSDQGAPAANRRRTPQDATRDAAMRTLDDLTGRSLLPAYAAERAESLITTGTDRSRALAARWASAAGSLDYATAFAALCADSQRGHLRWTPAEGEAYRAVQGVADEMRAGPMGTGAGVGGGMIPLTLEPAIMLSSSGSTNPLRQVSRVVQTTTNEWQGVTSVGTSAEWKAEHAQATAADVNVSEKPIPVHLGDVDVIFSYEINMAALNFLGELQKVILDAADQLQSTAFTVGSGVGQPKGVIWNSFALRNASLYSHDQGASLSSSGRPANKFVRWSTAPGLRKALHQA